MSSVTISKALVLVAAATSAPIRSGPTFGRLGISRLNDTADDRAHSIAPGSRTDVEHQTAMAHEAV
jgi:hypothetical protein